MQLGDGRADSADLLKVVKAVQPRAPRVRHGARWRSEAGTVVSAVMLGAIAGSGLFPFARERLRGGGARPAASGAEASLRGFARAFELVALRHGCNATASRRPLAPPRAADADGHARPQAAAPRSVAAGVSRRRCTTCSPSATPACWSTRARLRRSSMCSACSRCWPPSARPTRRRARLRHHARDGALAGAVDGVRRHRAGGRPQEPRQSRWQRVQGRGEGRRRRPAARLRPLQAGRARIRGAAAGARWRSRVLRWDRKRVRAGKQPWAMPLKIGTHSGDRHAGAARAGRR